MVTLDTARRCQNAAVLGLGAVPPSSASSSSSSSSLNSKVDDVSRLEAADVR